MLGDREDGHVDAQFGDEDFVGVLVHALDGV